MAWKIDSTKIDPTLSCHPLGQVFIKVGGLTSRLKNSVRTLKRSANLVSPIANAYGTHNCGNEYMNKPKTKVNEPKITK